VRFRYSAWDGTQDPLGPDLSASDLLDAMSEDILAGEGAEGALQRLLRRGIRGRFSGTDALAARLRQARRREQERLDLEGPLREVAERLDDILERERTALSFRADEDARMREAFLDALPPDLPGRLNELRDYRFADGEAQRRFDELMQHLTEQVLGAYFRNLAGGLRDLSPQELQRFKDMLAELNAMIEARDRGEPYDFEGFMQRYEDLFPDNPGSLDELLENLARRMAALSRLLASMSPDQRQELEDEARDAGGLAEPTGATRPWRFGDAGQVAVQRTVFNAVAREGPGAAVRLLPDDFELVEAEARTETATALLLDLSFSMPLRGHFVHAKRMALALHALIEGRYPHDRLYMIGFSDYARRMEPQDLTAAGWERVYGTNMQHAFNLAGRLLANHPRATRQVIMVTDGEPTAHLEGEEVVFSWPPVAETIRRTLSEAMRLARAGVTLNVFMLEDSPGLIRFMERLARVTAGRVFLMDDR